MTATTAAGAQPTAAKAPGQPPVIKGIEMTETGWKETVALWLTKDDATAKLKGFIMDGDKKRHVLGFINLNEVKGTKYIKLSESIDGKLTTVGTGNPINKHGDGSQVHFDTLAFNVGDKSIFGRLTKAATDELQKELGFTSARVPRPASTQQADESAMEAADQSARPRG